MSQYPELKKLIFECACGITQVMNEQDFESINNLAEDMINNTHFSCGCALATEQIKDKYIYEDRGRQVFDRAYLLIGCKNKLDLSKVNETSPIKLISAHFACSCGLSYSVKFIDHVDHDNLGKGKCPCGKEIMVITINEKDLLIINEDNVDLEVPPEYEELENQLLEENISDERRDEIIQKLNAFNLAEPECEQGDENKIILSLQLMYPCEIRQFDKHNANRNRSKTPKRQSKISHKKKRS
ncbi:MAG: hypothetical protein AB1782_04085 [Cyanobacteriota bacterium]